MLVPMLATEPKAPARSKANGAEYCLECGSGTIRKYDRVGLEGAHVVFNDRRAA